MSSDKLAGTVPGMAIRRWPRRLGAKYPGMLASRPHGRDARAERKICPRRPGLDELASIHDGDAIRDARNDAEIVRDEQQRHAELALQVFQQRQDLRLNGDVKRAGRLVCDHEIGAAEQCGRDHHALAQASGQLMRILSKPCLRDW